MFVCERNTCIEIRIDKMSLLKRNCCNSSAITNKNIGSNLKRVCLKESLPKIKTQEKVADNIKLAAIWANFCLIVLWDES